MTIKTRNQIFSEGIESLRESQYRRVNGLVTASARGFSAEGISGFEAVKKLIDDIECAEFVARQIRKHGRAVAEVSRERASGC